MPTGTARRRASSTGTSPHSSRRSGRSIRSVRAAGRSPRSRPPCAAWTRRCGVLPQGQGRRDARLSPFRGVNWFDTVDFPKDGDGCRWDSTPHDPSPASGCKASGTSGCISTVRCAAGSRPSRQAGGVPLVRRPLLRRSTRRTAPRDRLHRRHRHGRSHFLTDSDGEHMRNPHGRRDGEALADRAASLSAFPAAHRAAGREARPQRSRRLPSCTRKSDVSAWTTPTRPPCRSFASYDVIAHENLNLAGMANAPAPKPDPEQPGAFLANGAAAKAGLNKSILDAGWGLFLDDPRGQG